MVGDDAVDLFGHGTIEAPQSRFHVGDGQAQLGRGESARQSGVGIPVDEDGVWRFLLEHRFDSAQHGPSLRSVGSTSDTEVVVGQRNGKLLEKNIGHFLVVVLAILLFVFRDRIFGSGTKNENINITTPITAPAPTPTRAPVSTPASTPSRSPASTPNRTPPE